MDNARELLLMRGKTGLPVGKLKKALRKVLGTTAATYPGLMTGDNFDADTEGALRAWQASVGLVADGIAGPRILSALGLRRTTSSRVKLDCALVGKLFPAAKAFHIATNLPYIAAALAAFGLNDEDMMAVALGTIGAEADGLMPIAELPSHFNTLPGQAAFSKYEFRLGNIDAGDGALYRGRGYVQLTGRESYETYGKLFDIPLAEYPDCACAPEVAACLLAAHLCARQHEISRALTRNSLRAARKAVNGNDHGLNRFSHIFRMARQVRDASMRTGVGATTAPAASAARRTRQNVQRDAADLRDRAYQPPPRSLPQAFPSDDAIRDSIVAYGEAGLILDQGQEGACTGFGLACVINYLRWRSAGMPRQFESVSPRMLYHFARRYDEYDGEDYSGSSCRGALKGWFHNGVCLESKWSYAAGEQALPLAGWHENALEHTLGVYYRIEPQAITDLQAAILEVGAIYVSAYTHKGWDALQASPNPPSTHADLPLIVYSGRQSHSDGHAFALVGFNRDGFVLQNSWGTQWGAGGFAVISYADWLAHAMDAWVAAMGVPGVIAGRLASGSRSQLDALAAGGHWWEETRAYRHSIVLGNNGRVARYDPLDAMTRSLLNQACVLPDRWFRTGAPKTKRLVIYAHGGLNSEEDAIRRVRAMGRYFIGNGCYPLFLVWKSGLLEALGNILADKMRAGTAGLTRGMGDWIADRLSDPLIEKLIARPFARPFWSEMKENAELAVESGRGGDLLTEALRSLAGTWGDQFELHLIGHSAGAIVLGKLLASLAQKNLSRCVKSVHLHAPACTVAFANRYYAPHANIMTRLYLDILSDQREQDDHVAHIYRKSLLYLVANALEADSRTPILGLEKTFLPDCSGWDGSSATAETLANWRNVMETHQLQARLTIHSEERFITRRDGEQAAKTEIASHGGFDNNVDLLGKTLERITGAALGLPVNDLAGY